MIVLWNRIQNAAGGIRDTEWLLLVLEAFGVVIGVFLAFQLQEWSEDRREARAQERLLERLLEESRLSVDYLRTRHEGQHEYVQDAIPVIEKMNSGTCPTEDELRLLRFIDRYPPITPPETVYLELVNGMGLSAVPDIEVRDAISAYRRRLEYTQQQNQKFNFAPVYDQSTPGVRFIFIGNPREPSRLDLQSSVLCADQEFKNKANNVLRNQFRMQQYRYILLQASVHMCLSLAQAKNTECFTEKFRNNSDDDLQDMLEMDARLHDGDLEFHKLD